MKLSDVLKDRICEWFDTIYTVAYNEELEWLTQLGTTDPSFDPNKITKDELREIAVEHVDADQVIEGMIDKCERSKLECAIIEALLEENGFVRVKVSDATYSWQQLSAFKKQRKDKKR